MKKTGVFMKTMCILAVSVFLFFLAVQSSQGRAMGATPRPLSDFLDAQGSMTSFFPPVPDYVGWIDNSFTIFALVDYAGLADQYLIHDCGLTAGTTVTGSVIERPLPGGKAEIQVNLHTNNAMGFAQSIEELADNGFEFDTTPTIFGNKTKDVCGGADAAIGWATLHATFTIESSGADLPDLVDVVNQDPVESPWSLNFKAKIFDGESHLDVHQKVAADLDENGEPVVIWSKEIVDIK